MAGASCWMRIAAFQDGRQINRSTPRPLDTTFVLKPHFGAESQTIRGFGKTSNLPWISTFLSDFFIRGALCIAIPSSEAFAVTAQIRVRQCRMFAGARQLKHGRPYMEPATSVGPNVSRSADRA